MKIKHIRIAYLILVFLVMTLGLLSRKFSDTIPDIIDLFLGDCLWSLMIYFMARTIFINSSIKKTALISILFCFSIEFSQLYHADWINYIRRTTLGGLVLGYGFLWSDLVWYLLGITFGIIINLYVESRFKFIK
ncbi:MAG: DUF2809 domain-containing protein [Clostridiaceae bacterium]